MIRRAYSGRLVAEWEGATRRWRVYGPGRIFMLGLPGSREQVVAFMRVMNGLPTGVEMASLLDGRGKGAVMRRAALGLPPIVRLDSPKHARARKSAATRTRRTRKRAQIMVQPELDLVAA